MDYSLIILISVIILGSVLIGIAVASLILSSQAIKQSFLTEAKVQGLKESTHTMYPVQLGGNKNLEEDLKKVMGDFSINAEKMKNDDLVQNFSPEPDIDKLV